MSIEIPDGWANVSVALRMTGDAEPMAMTWAIGPGTIDPDPAVAQTLAILTVNALSTGNAPLAAANMYNDWTFESVTVGIKGPLGIVSWEQPALVVGTNGASEHPPVNCAVLLHKTTGVGGRRGRGRLYCPPVNLPDTAVSNTGVILPAIVTLFNTRWDVALTALAAGGAAMYLAHSPLPGGALLDPNEVLQVTCDSRIATQRRRLRR